MSLLLLDTTFLIDAERGGVDLDDAIDDADDVAIAAVTVAWTDKRQARSQGYKYTGNAGGKSRKTWASRTMIYTGAILFIFVIGHIYLFKFGNHEIDAHGVKNLYKTVVTVFKGAGFTIFTVVAMLLLGFHLRHGFWSAFQSLGWANDRYLPVLVKVGYVFAVVLLVHIQGLAGLATITQTTLTVSRSMAPIASSGCPAPNSMPIVAAGGNMAPPVSATAPRSAAAAS